MAAPDRNPLLRRIVAELEADERVAAAWLAGSIGRGEDDPWSDLDLHVAVYDLHLDDFWNGRIALYERVGRPVLIQAEMPSNAQAGGHFQLVIFDGPLEVDWNVGPLSRATRQPSHALLFAREDVPQATLPTLSPEAWRARAQDRLIFLWAMAPIVVKYIARSDTERAVRQIALVRDAYIDLWRMVETGNGSMGGFNQPLEPALRASLPRLGPAIDPQECLRVLQQLCDRTVELHERLAALGVTIPDGMPGQLARLIASVPSSSRA
jgi:predicted nucleotidyltransferase